MTVVSRLMDTSKIEPKTMKEAEEYPEEAVVALS
jgi:hypothetical protein